uniref:Uncharacterized protein n=2 Tax=Clastoptera arizonana TaxID=38151 RepID=A0A1B6D3H3_9HEMI
MSETRDVGSMKKTIGAVCEKIQNMETIINKTKAIDDLSKKTNNHKLMDIEAEKNQQYRLSTLIDSQRGFVEGLHQLQQNVIHKVENLRESNTEIKELLQQEKSETTYNLNSYEEKMADLVEKFCEVQNQNSSHDLMDGIVNLKQELKSNQDGLKSFRKDLEEFSSKYLNDFPANEDFKTASFVFNSIHNDISLETKKLSMDMDKLNNMLQNYKQELVLLKSQYA